ncbi:MAG: 23S rRNA (uracil(1939)-C(5))-methyltransferase RlmD [Deltaproteobacteria bacterium]|nr:23S rRNA (uracil(1939)-C(5))-methyltransferase RlmD [Deltaproteobacteria bacterium]
MIITVEINALVYRGLGIGRVEGRVVFVPFTAPGDVIEAEVTSEEKGFLSAKVKKIKHASPDRQEPECKYFFECGGCQWQHIKYEAQLRWKKTIFDESAKRLAKADIAEPFVIAAPSEYGYRSRARFQVKSGMVGFFKAASHDIVDIESCPLLVPELNAALTELRALRFPEELESVELSRGDSEGVVAVFHLSGKTKLDWKAAVKGSKHIKGFEVMLRGPQKRGAKEEKILSEGDTVISYEAGGLELRASAGAFSQVNLVQNRALIKEVMTKAALNGSDTVVDMFCGNGNMSLPLAKKVNKIIGIDSSRPSVKAAIDNASFGRIENAEFLKLSASGLFLRKLLDKTSPSVIILDPPRGGAFEAVSAVAARKTKRIVYVSCNPATFARDLSFLAKKGYSLVSATVIDMFAGTYHIESVAEITKS